MIQIDRHETKVRLRIEHGLLSANGSELWLYWECDKEMFAELMENKLRKKLEDRIEAIRKEEYERGWKDAKAKRRKAIWFASVLRLIYTR